MPHWRADDVSYYVTFRHRRPLEDAEIRTLFTLLLRPDGKRWDLLILCVLPERSELIFRVRESPSGKPYELSQIVEKAKTKAGKAIIHNTGEKFPPFYNESYDRIIRDEAELEERWQALFDSPTAEGCEPDEYRWLWVAGTE